MAKIYLTNIALFFMLIGFCVGAPVPNRRGQGHGYGHHGHGQRHWGQGHGGWRPSAVGYNHFQHQTLPQRIPIRVIGGWQGHGHGQGPSPYLPGGIGGVQDPIQIFRVTTPTANATTPTTTTTTTATPTTKEAPTIIHIHFDGDKSSKGNDFSNDEQIFLVDEAGPVLIPNEKEKGKLPLNSEEDGQLSDFDIEGLIDVRSNF